MDEEKFVDTVEKDGEEYLIRDQRVNGLEDRLNNNLNEVRADVRTKVSKTSLENKVYGTDANGNQKLYDKDDFGKVDDVRVNGESVVSEKIANVDLTPYAKLIGRLPEFTVNKNDNILNFITTNSLIGKPIIIHIIEGNLIHIGSFYNQIGATSFAFEFETIGSTYRYSGNADVSNLTFANIFSSDTYRQDYELEKNKVTSIVASSTNTQYPSAKAVWDLVQAIKRNSFIKVNIEEYPTLADFLESTGEEGYIYLYPVDTSDLTKGYKQYIWEDNSWLYLGDTKIDLTNYPTLDGENVFTGNNNTFENVTVNACLVQGSTSIEVSDIAIKEEPITKVEEAQDIPDNELGLYKYPEDADTVIRSSHIVEIEKEEHGAEDTKFEKITDSNNQQVNDDSAFMSQFSNGLSNFISVGSLTKAYTLKYTPVEGGDLGNIVSGIRFGTSSQPGFITLTLSEGGILAFTQYFSYNGSTGEIVNWEDADTILIENTQTAELFELELDNYDTDPYIIEVPAGSYNIRSAFEKRFILSYFQFEQAPYSLYKKHQLARVEEVEDVESSLESHITTSTERFRTDERAIQQNADDIVTTNNKIGPVQIYQVYNRLPNPTEEFLNRIYRFDEKLYQCVKRGNGVHKDWGYNVNGTSEITTNNYEGFANEVGLEYKDYLTSLEDDVLKASKLYRNNGNIKLGSSSNTGYIALFNLKAEEDLPITSLKIGVKAYSSSKPSCISIESDDGFGSSTTLIEDNVEETLITVPYEGSYNNLDYIYIESRSTYYDESGDEPVIIQCDKRLIITRVIADFGETTYEWIPVAPDSMIDITEGLTEEIRNKVTANPSCMLIYNEYVYIPQFNPTGNIPNFYNCFEGDGLNFKWLEINWEDLEIDYYSKEYVDTASNQTITGTKTINKIVFPSTATTYISNEDGRLTIRQNDDIYIQTTRLRPKANNTTDLGTSAYKWKDLYLSGKVYIGASSNTIYEDSSQRLVLTYQGNDRIKIGSANTVIANRLDPDNDNSQDIGRSTVRWKDLYLSGNITDGTYQTTVAQINNNLAPSYDNTTTYAVGDKVIYQGSLYQCSTAITTAEAWDSTHWTAISVSDGFIDLSTEQTINVIKKFDTALGGNLKIVQNGVEKFAIYPDGNTYNTKLNAQGTTQIRFDTNQINFYKNIAPLITGDLDLGVSNQKWRDLYLSRNLTDGTNSVSVADISNGSFNVINVTDMTDSTHFTQDQISIINNGKMTRIVGALGSNQLNNVTFLSCQESANGYLNILISYTNSQTDKGISYLDVRKSDGFVNIRNNKIYFSQNEVRITTDNGSSNTIYLNGKKLPDNPSDTGTFVNKMINGTWSWEEEYEESVAFDLYKDFDHESVGLQKTYDGKIQIKNGRLYIDYRVRFTNPTASAIPVGFGTPVITLPSTMGEKITDIDGTPLSETTTNSFIAAAEFVVNRGGISYLELKHNGVNQIRFYNGGSVNIPANDFMSINVHFSMNLD